MSIRRRGAGPFDQFETEFTRMTNNPNELTIENSAVVLIDHQPWVAFAVESIDKSVLINNVTGLALAAKRVGLDVHLDHLRQRRHSQMVGHDRADRVALAVIRLLAQKHEIGLLLLERLG